MMRYRGGATVVALVMEARSWVPQACHMESHGDIAKRCGHSRLTFFIGQSPTKMVSMDQLMVLFVCEATALTTQKSLQKPS